MGWLRVDDHEQRPANVLRTSECLSDEAYGEAGSGTTALAFGRRRRRLGTGWVHYHFHHCSLLRFKCGWLSLSELMQAMPNATRKTGRDFFLTSQCIRNI